MIYLVILEHQIQHHLQKKNRHQENLVSKWLVMMIYQQTLANQFQAIVIAKEYEKLKKSRDPASYRRDIIR